MNPVAVTSILVAAARAEESKRSDRLFDDPFAHALAGEIGYPGLAAQRDVLGLAILVLAVRTRWYDEALARATATGIAQGVILAAGMDARAYRLAWPAGTRLFEVDQPDVIAYKAGILGANAPTTARVAIAEDLSNDWPTALRAAGFDPEAPTVWLVEGLLIYLDAAAVRTLFARIDGLSAPRSIVLYDLVSTALLQSPALAPAVRRMTELGSPWLYGSDDPADPVAPHGWEATAIEPSEAGLRWGRWPLPPTPAGASVPRNYLVEASKRGAP